MCVVGGGGGGEGGRGRFGIQTLISVLSLFDTENILTLEIVSLHLNNYLYCRSDW